eukprot:201449-Chlamydomonas_euryale.AAC.4
MMNIRAARMRGLQTTTGPHGRGQLPCTLHACEQSFLAESTWAERPGLERMNDAGESMIKEQEE